MERYMTGDEIRQMARKYHNPTDRINEGWNPIYIAECRKIIREAIEKSLMEKYVPRKINTSIKKSKLFAHMGKA